MMRVRPAFDGIAMIVLALSWGACGVQEAPESEASVPRASSDGVESATGVEFEGLMVHAQRARAAAEQEVWEGALDEYFVALGQEPYHPILLYRAARFEAKLGRADAAIDHLERLAAVGGTGELESDPFFDGVRDHDGYQAVAERLAMNAEPHPPAEVVVTFDDAELWPEGIATDATTGDIYVGSFRQNKVVRVSPDGRVTDFGTTAADGLQAVVGIWVDSQRGELWAATGDQAAPGAPLEPGEVVRYSTETGELVSRYPGPRDDQPQLLNDVTVGPDGTAYITESLGGRIFQITSESQALELYQSHPHLAFINGIAISDDGSTLYFAHIEGLSAVDLASGESTRVRAADGSVLGMGDGLSWAGDGLVIVQNQAQMNFRVVLAKLDGTGRQVSGISVLPSGLPDGLIPFTSAVHEGAAYVVASADFALMEGDEVPPPPVVVRMAL